MITSRWPAIVAAAVLLSGCAATVTGSGALDRAALPTTSAPAAPKLAQRWSTDVGGATGSTARLLDSGGADSATMAFVGTADGRVFGLDAGTGRVVWTARPSTLTSTGVGVAGNQVLYYDAINGIIALAQATGRVTWRHAVSLSGGNDVAPAIASGVLALETDAGLIGVAPNTGSQMWTANSLPTLDGQPVALGNRFFVASDGSNGDNSQVSAVSAATGTVLWQHGVAIGSDDNQFLYVAGNLVLFEDEPVGGGTPTVTALDPASGRQVWTAPAPDASGSSAGRPVTYGADIVFPAADGLRAFDAKTGRVAWTVSLPFDYDDRAAVPCGSLLCTLTSATVIAVGTSGKTEQTVSVPPNSQLAQDTTHGVYALTSSTVYRYD